MREPAIYENSFKIGRWTQVLLALVATSLLAVLVFAESPEQTRLWGEIFNSGHAPLFGIVAIITLILSANILRTQFTAHIDHYVFSAFVCAVLGIVTELIQGQIGRDADPIDVLRDVAGTVSFLMVAATFDRSFKNRRFFMSSAFRSGFRILAAVILLATFVPVVVWATAYMQRDRQFPVLCEYDSYLSRLFLATEYATISPAKPPSGWLGQPDAELGKLTFEPSTYPGLTINEPYPDWTGYSDLSFDVFSPLQTPVGLTVRVHDIHHNWETSDRFNRTFQIAPGMNHIVIPLAEIKTAPVGRLMDMVAIRQIILFAYSPIAPFSLYISPLKLN